MCDWFTFYPDHDAKVLRIDVNIQNLLETQPYDYDETDEFCTEILLPIVKDVRTTCIANGYMQEFSVDLKDIDVLLLRPTVLSRIIWNVYDATKDEPEDLIKSFEVVNANKIFRSIYRVTSKLLPSYIVNLITVS